MGPTSPLRMSESAERVLDAYIEVVRRGGLPSATLQKAARLAKVPFATAHYHWGGKGNALLTAALEKTGKSAQLYITEAIERAVAGRRDPIREYVDGTFRWAREKSGEARFWVYFYYHSASLPKNVRVHQTFIEQARSRVLRLLHEAKGMGFYPKMNPDPRLAGWIHAIVLGNGVLAITRSDLPESVDELREETLDAVVRLIG